MDVVRVTVAVVVSSGPLAIVASCCGGSRVGVEVEEVAEGGGGGGGTVVASSWLPTTGVNRFGDGSRSAVVADEGDGGGTAIVVS